MKICDVVCNSIWFDPRVTRQIAEYKKREDIELSCVGFYCDRYNADAIEKMGVKTRIEKLPDKYTGKMDTLLKKVWRERLRVQVLMKAIMEEKPDIIHANDLDALIPAMHAAKKLKCKVIFDSHELCAENARTARVKVLHWYLSKQEKKYVKKCDLMVCVSNAAATYFMEKYHIVKPTVVTNCMLQSYIPKEGIMKHSGFEVLNHGRFSRARGYDILAKTCALLGDYPEIKLAIRGLGYMEDELRTIVAQSPNRENFIFYPPVNAQELTKQAAMSHVGIAITEPICLNYKLSVSNKLFEYAAAGLPVIMSDIPEHRYLNNKYHFGIILKENTPQALAETIIGLYEDNGLYQQLASNAKRMTEEINWETVFGKLIDKEREILQ